MFLFTYRTDLNCIQWEFLYGVLLHVPCIEDRNFLLCFSLLLFDLKNVQLRGEGAQNAGIKVIKKITDFYSVTPPLADFCTLEKVSLGRVQFCDVPRELIRQRLRIS